jgi:hypothetical protein
MRGERGQYEQAKRDLGEINGLLNLCRAQGDRSDIVRGHQRGILDPRPAGAGGDPGSGIIAYVTKHARETGCELGIASSPGFAR